MDAIIKANDNHAVGYGDDPWTEAATSKIQEVFGKDASPFFVFNGTGANSVALQAVTRPFNSILCAETAHINVDECGAPARMTGRAIVTIPTTDGKLTPEIDPSPSEELRGLPPFATQGRFISPKYRKLGTIYTIEESESDRRSLTFVRYVSAYGRSPLGERCAYLNCTMRQVTIDAGVDILSFGGTKNGMMMGEARGLVPPGDHGEPAILPEAIRPASLEATLSLPPSSSLIWKITSGWRTL